MRVTHTPNLVGFHSMGKGEDSKTDCDDARKHLEIFLFFRKVLLAYRWFNLDVLFIYSKENSNCINWHLLASISAFIKHVRIQRGEQGVRDPPPPPPPPPLKNHKNIGFLINTGPDPLKNRKATKPAFKVGTSSARQRNAI